MCLYSFLKFYPYLFALATRIGFSVSNSIKGHLPLKVVFHRRLSSMKYLRLLVLCHVFHGRTELRIDSEGGCFPRSLKLL